MKLTFVRINKTGDLVCKNENGHTCHVDLFVGLAEKNILSEEFNKTIQRGDIIVIPDNTHIFEPTFLPNEYKLIKKE